jgi:hypothetical protein
MQIPIDSETREQVLMKLPKAVAFQIGLWDATGEISEALDCELQHVLDYVNGAAIVADGGMDLTHKDLDDLLGIGVPGRIIRGTPLKPATKH